LDSAGNIYVAGRTNSFCCGAFLLKYNSTGNLLWQRVLLNNSTSPYYDSAASAMAVDSTGNVYLAGFTDSTSVRGRDVLLARFDSSGNLVWQEHWGGNESDTGQGVALDRLGAIYVTGTTSSFSASTNQNVFVLKLRANGSLIWQKIWGDLIWGSGSGISVDSSSNLYVSGYYGYSPNNPTDALLLKLNSTGSLLWQERWNLGNQNSYFSSIIANAVATDSAGNAYITGTSNYNINGVYYPGIAIMKFNPDGTIAWQRVWVRSVNYCCQQTQNGNSLALDRTGDIYVTGQAGYYPSETTPMGFLILELSPRGDLEWQGTTAADDRDAGKSLTVDSSGDAVAVGDIYEAPPSNLPSLNVRLLTGNFTLQTITGQLTPTNTTVSPLNMINSTPIGLQTYSDQGDAYLLKLQPPIPSPPSPPLAFVAQAGQNNISLSWAPPQYTGGHPLTGYNIYKGLSAGGETLLASTSTARAYVDSNAKVGVSYYYYVKAVNSLGESDASNENYATVGASVGVTIPINSTILGGASVLVLAVVGFVVYQRRKRTLHFG